jgi:hypothetical protein
MVRLTHEIRAAPIRPEPMYPAGKVICLSAATSWSYGELTIGTPPRILVDPPSLGNNYHKYSRSTINDRRTHTDILNLGACDDLILASDRTGGGDRKLTPANA